MFLTIIPTLDQIHPLLMPMLQMLCPINQKVEISLPLAMVPMPKEIILTLACPDQLLILMVHCLAPVRRIIEILHILAKEHMLQILFIVMDQADQLLNLITLRMDCLLYTSDAADE